MPVFAGLTTQDPGLLRVRPRSSEDRKRRLKHLRVAYFRLVEGRTLPWLRKRYRVSTRTLQLWVRAALNYRDPEATALRCRLGLEVRVSVAG